MEDLMNVSRAFLFGMIYVGISVLFIATVINAAAILLVYAHGMRRNNSMRQGDLSNLKKCLVDSVLCALISIASSQLIRMTLVPSKYAFVAFVVGSLLGFGTSIWVLYHYKTLLRSQCANAYAMLRETLRSH